MPSPQINTSTSAPLLKARLAVQVCRLAACLVVQQQSVHSIRAHATLHTSVNHAAGAEQDLELINRWGADTFQHFSRLHASDQGAIAGCISTNGYALYSGGSNSPPVGGLFYYAHMSTCRCAGHAACFATSTAGDLHIICATTMRCRMGSPMYCTEWNIHNISCSLAPRKIGG